MKVAEEGLRWVAAAAGVTDGDLVAVEAAVALPAIHRAQSGLVADMDQIADVVYHRAAKRGAAAQPGVGAAV